MPPSIRFTVAEPRFQFARTSSIPAYVEATDPDGSVDRVIFVARNASNPKPILLSAVTNAPFTVLLRDLDVGEWTVEAQAVDNLGATASAYLFVNITNIPPLNDNFADASLLSGTNVSSVGWTLGATIEPDELDWGGGSVWYSWTAPANGRLRVAVPDWGYGTVFGVFIGSSVSNLNPVVANFDGWDWYTAIESDVFGGTNYFIAVVNSYGGVAHFTLDLQFHPAMLVRLINPTDTERFSAFVPLPLRAEANTVPGETLTHVDFLSDGLIIGSIAAPPYAMLWTNALPGEHTIGARAYDSAGTTRDSTTVQVSVAPPNDDFEQRVTLLGTNLSLIGTTRGASLQTDEPMHSDLAQAASVWWAWTAPGSGRATLSVTYPSIWTAIGVYTGTELTGLTRVASGFAWGYGWPSTALDVQEGVTYAIAIEAVASYAAPFEGDFTLNLQLAPTPTNDSFASRLALLGSSLLATGTTTAATIESDEPTHSGQPASHSVWYSWVAPTSAYRLITVLGSTFNPVCTVYTGPDLADLTEVVSGTRVGFRAQAGIEYSLAIDGQDATFGDFTLAIETAPENDDFTNRIALTGSTLIVTGANFAASSEPPEAVPRTSAGAKSLWWSWTAPVEGCVSIRFVESDFEASLAVYRGTDLTNLLLVPSELKVMAGERFEIAVDGVNHGAGAQAGTFAFAINEIPRPSNDNFADRIQIEGTNTWFAVTNSCATREVNEPSSAGNGSLWWTWTAPSAGKVTVRTYSGTVDTTLGVFSGVSLATLASLGIPNWEFLVGRLGGVMTLDVQTGTVLQIRGDTSPGQGGGFILWLTFSPPPPNDNFAARIRLVGTNATVHASNRGASREPLEPSYTGGWQANRSLWWSWTAPATGLLTVTVAHSDFLPSWGAYTGSTLSQLVPVASALAWVYGPAQGAFSVQAGTTYQIVVDSLQRLTHFPTAHLISTSA